MKNDVLKFVIPGEPCGKARPRFDSRNKRTYTPAKTVKYEKLVATMFRAAYPGHVPDPSLPPVEVVVGCWFGLPKSWSMKKRTEHYLKPCTKKPDADNLAKIICDALNGLAFVDDAQVYHVAVWKKWAKDGCVSVEIREARHA